MNASGSMALSATVRPCCRLLYVFQKCPFPPFSPSLFPKCHHHRLADLHALAAGRHARPSLVRAAVAPAPDAAPVIRRLSTSVDPGPGDKAFERIYVQGGLAAVKPLVIERKQEGEVKEPAPVAAPPEAAPVREESELEKEAWRLLKRAVVTYCGNPVGTVAADDPAGQPLNYDQVFIRDFVPSALAFLLKGESEIVKNFLLHTLQLQV